MARQCNIDHYDDSDDVEVVRKDMQPDFGRVHSHFDGHHYGGVDWADGTSGEVKTIFSRRKEAELRAQLDQAWLRP